MRNPTQKRLLLLGSGASVVVVALGIGIAALAGAFSWQSLSIGGLSLVIFLISLQMVQAGSQMSAFADPQQVYIEAVAREASERGFSDIQHSTVRVFSMWAMIPPIVGIIVIGFVF